MINYKNVARFKNFSKAAFSLVWAFEETLRKFFRTQVKQDFKALFAKGIIYSLLAAFIIMVGSYCGDSGTRERLKTPDTVVNFRIEGSDRRLIASWDKMSGRLIGTIQKYRIFMDDDSGVSMMLAEYMPNNDGEGERPSLVLARGLQDEEFVNGKKYALQIHAVNSQGEGPKSPKVYAMPRPESLGALTGLRILTNRSRVTLTWNHVPGATEYRMFRSSTRGVFDEEPVYVGRVVDMCSLTRNECTHEDTDGLEDGKTYYYRVVAAMVIDDEQIQETEREEVLSARGGESQATPKLRGDNQPTVVARNVSGQARVELIITDNVNASEEITGYRIETLNNDGTKTLNNDGEEIDDVDVPRDSSGTTKHTLEQAYGTTRRYEVTALQGEASSYRVIQDSTDTDAQFLSLPEAPLAVEGFNAVARASSLTIEIELSWDSIARVTHYTIKRTPVFNEMITRLEKKELSFFTRDGERYKYTDNDVQAGGSYFYTITPIVEVSLEGGGSRDLSGPSVNLGPVNIPTEVAENVTEFVDPFIGTEYTHREAYQPSRVYPLASVPFGMVQFTVANGFHKGVWWKEPNDNEGAKNGGRQLPTYVGTERNKIKGFSAFSFQGPGCNLAHDFLMMPSTEGGTGNNRWLGRIAAGNPGNDFKIKTPRTLRQTQESRQAAVDNDNIEWAEAGYYRVKTRNNTLIEISATKRTGIMKITYGGGVNKGYFHLAAYTRSEDFEDADSDVNTSGAKRLEGQISAGKFCGEGGSFRYRMFMSGEFNRAFTAPSIRNIDKNEARVEFDVTSNKVVIYKFGISFVGYVNARKNMQGDGDNNIKGENTGHDFALIKSRANTAWNNVLKKIKVRDSHQGTGTDYSVRTNEKRRLYTYFFRSLLHPNIFSDVDGRYPGFDGALSIKTLPSNQKEQYQYFSNWDIYRSQIPLIAFLHKDIARDIARSLVNNANQAGNSANSGGFTRWGVANHDSGVMGGDSGSIMVSSIDAFATLTRSEHDGIVTIFNRLGKLSDTNLHGCFHFSSVAAGTCSLTNIASHYRGGVLTSNTRSAGSGLIYSLQINNNPFSKILEFAYADYARSAFINRSLAKYPRSDDARKARLTGYASAFKQSSHGWTQLFRDGNAAFKLRTTKRHRMHVASRCQWHGGHACYHEGNRNQYEWYMHYDMAGLFREMNLENSVDPTTKIVTPNATLLGRLNDLFSPADLISGETGNTYNAGNQVGFGTPYSYYYLARPNETIRIVREKLGKKYWPDTYQAYPGNEDGGSMSSQFLWGFVGLYPHTLGTDRLLLLYPAFDYIEFDLSDGSSAKKLILKRDISSTVGTNATNGCIEKVTADGIDIDLTSTEDIKNDHNWTKSYINYRNITASTTLSFKIVSRQGRNCTTTWGKKESDIPPSNTDM